MKTVEDFLNEINEKSWRSNMELEVGRKFDELLEELSENREKIINEITTDVKRIEDMKVNEDNQAFTYSIFHEWLDYCSRSVLSDKFKGE